MTLSSSFQSLLVPQVTQLQKLDWSLANNAGVNVWMKRADLVHPDASGNKWYKLVANVAAMEANGCNGLLSFGGGYSNHLHALALVGQRLGIRTIGVVRGVYRDNLTPTLIDCKNAGMTLEFVDRQQWVRRSSFEYCQFLREFYANPWIVPEGGSNKEGVEGTRLLGREIIQGMSAITDARVKLFIACGTGTTLAGIIAEATEQFDVTGISVLKGKDTLTEFIQHQLSLINCRAQCSWRVDTNWHCGGYAKYPEYLSQFVTEFEQENGFLLDPVYTAKVLFAVAQMLITEGLKKGENLVILHSGGLQGRRGFAPLFTGH